MKCDDCKLALWKRTTNGRLHPDKQGRCGWTWLPPPIPYAFSFSYGHNGEPPKPNGGYIERGRELRRDCVCYVPAR